MGVIMMDEGQNPIESYLRDWMQRKQQDEMQQRQLAQQQSQFDAAHALEVERTKAQTGMMGAQTAASKYGVSSDRAARVIANAVPILERYRASGDTAGEIAYARSVLAQYQDDPEIQAQFGPLVQERGQTSLDVTQENLGKWKTDVTGRVAGGTGTAADQNLAFKLGTGEQISAPAFEDVQNREMGPKAHQQYVSIKSDRTPGATAQLQAGTQLTMSREGNASAERIAGARIAADGKGGAAGAGPAGSGLATEALGVIEILKQHPGKSGAVGFKGLSSLYGLKEEPFGGSQEAGYNEQVNRLRALLTLPNLQHLKGLGHMSDREFATMQAAATALSGKLPEQDFNRELSRVQQVMENVSARADMTSRLSGGNSGGSFKQTATHPGTGQRIGTNDGVTWFDIATGAPLR